jgi:hypothetical protein
VQAGGLWADCHDTGQPGTPPPSQDVVIRLEPHGSSGGIDVATVDADPEGGIDVVVRIPEDTPAGPAAVVVWASSATLEVATR